LPKKTTEIIINGKNDYIVAVKKNQIKLYKLLEEKTKTQIPVSETYEHEVNRDREITRRVEVFEDLGCINQIYWRGIKSIICVNREGKRGGKPYQERIFYISSLKLTAREFNKVIREHWLIENQLHWVKDVIFSEDEERIRAGMAPHNFSIIRSIVINLLRKKGYKSLTQAQRFIANNINELFLCLT